MVDSCGLSILLKAWRERWTPLQWLVEIKKKVKKDGHKGLAECLVQQATFGTTPSMLILSYLKHGIMAEVVPCSEAIEAIQKFQNIEKHRCLKALLDLLLSFIPNLSCCDDGEDALDLTTSMVKLIYWLLIVAINLLKLSREAARSSDEASLHHHLGNTKLCHKAFSQLMSSPTYRSLIMVGKMEDPGIATELDCQFQAHMKELFVVTQSEGMVPEVQIHFKDLMINYNRLHSLTPLNGSGDHVPGVVPNIAVQNIVQIQNLVFPTDSPDQLAGLLDAAMRTQNITRLQLFLEVMRSSLVGMLESPPKSMEEAIWTGFFFFKLPRVLGEMENRYQLQGNQTTNMEHSTIQATLQQLRVFTPLLDDVDIKYKCNCYKEFIDQYCKYTPQQVAERLGNLSSARKSPSEQESVTLGQIYQPFLLLLDAESKVIPVLEALEDKETIKDDRFLSQLSSLFNVTHSKWRLVAIASLSKMPSLVAELIRLAEETKHPSEGDEVNWCVPRGDLFNAAFILLCHIVQVFGREVILEVARSRDLNRAFMTQWIASHLPESDHSRTYYSNPQYPPNPAMVNLLLSQFYTRGPFMTSDARWDDLCVNVPVAMHEMLKLWQHESNTCSSDTIQKLCESIKYEVPAWAICVCCWCCGYSHELRMENRAHYTGDIFDTGSPQLGLLQFLLTPINAKGMPQTFTDRCSMMVEVMKEISVNIERKDHIPNSYQPAPVNQTITKNLCQLFNDVNKQKNISSKTLRKFKQLLILGGAEWFCSTIIKEVLKFSRQEDIANAADIASCLVLLNTKLLVPVLIRRVIPLYLHHCDANHVLQDPKGWGLARLAAHAVNFGLLCEQSRDNEQQKQQGGEQGSSVKCKTETTQHFRFCASHSQIQKALVWLCEELVSVVDDNKVGPVASVLKNFLQQAAQCNSPTSGSVLACLPTELTENLLELTPVVCCTPDVILGICSLKNSDGRKLCARVLCRSKQND